MPAKKAAPAPEPVPAETPDPKAATRPSGALTATARAFDPRRAGVGKTMGAVAVVLATIAMAILFDLELLPNDGLAFYLYTILVGVAGNVLRHLGSRWKS